MMNFDEFLEAAKDRVQETIPDAEVKIQQVNKLQGESYTGISVQPEGAAAAVTFNVSPAFERYQEDESQKEAILGKIAADAKQVSSAIPVFSVSDITDYSTAKDHLVMQVVPVGPNKDMLENIPHKTVEDIAVVYRVELPDAADSSATTLVTNQLLAEYGVTADQLHADAVAAQIANHPPVLRNMSEMMAEMSGGLFDMPESPMWVATVDGGMNGASVTQLPAFLEEAADRLGGDFFVLPSSVHEVLFIRDDGSFEREDLENMVRGVNATEVSEADFLSDSVYHYDSDDHIFEKATMIREVLKTTGITATVGIGTNLYLAKVAMDIVAKKQPADKDGVRIAELNEDSYKFLLWEHRPLTDFWQIGPGKARRLQNACMMTMGDVAQRSQWDEEWFYKQFGIDGEILIDHAWGIEPVTMKDIKSYRSEGHSLSNGQVLPRPYKYPEARLVFREMIEVLCTDMFSKNLVTKGCTWWVSYDYKSLEACPGYDGPVSIDFYGRLHPKHSNGTVKLPTLTNNLQIITAPLLKQFDDKTDHRLLYRRLGVCANDVTEDLGIFQMNMFIDYDALERDRRLQGAMLEVRRKFGANAVFKGMNLLEGATTLERNQQIGGHKA